MLNILVIYSLINYFLTFFNKYVNPVFMRVFLDNKVSLVYNFKRVKGVNYDKGNRDCFKDHTYSVYTICGGDRTYDNL